MAAKRVLGGLTVVTVGLILLANTTGYLPWSVWWTILALWPLLLVAAGIDILGRALNSAALRALASLVVIGGLLYGAAAGAGRVGVPAFATTSGETFRFSEPHQGLAGGSAEIDAGLTKLTVRAGDAMATAEGTSPFGRPSFDASVGPSGREAAVRIASTEGRGPFAPGVHPTLAVTLDRTLPWTLKVSAGASDLDLDLSRLTVDKLDVNAGLSSTRVTFGTENAQGAGTMPGVQGAKQAEIDAGLSSLTVRVPRRAPVEIVVDNGLGSTVVRGGWTRVSGSGPFSGTWHTDGYDQAHGGFMRIVVKAGLSSVVVERY